MSLRARLVLLSAILIVAAGCSASTTTLLLVRHAEKGPGKDPDLTPEGRQRAEALIDVARRRGVAAVYHTQYKRSVQTAEPAAAALGIPRILVEYIPGQEPAHAEDVVRKILATYAGKVVLVVGHTTTLPALMARLGVVNPPEIPETEYGGLYGVVEEGSKGTLQLGKFGP